MTSDSIFLSYLEARDGAAEALAGRVSKIWAGLAQADPRALADRTGADFAASDAGSGEFRIRVWGRDVILTFPDFAARDEETGEPVDPFTQAIVAYYLENSDGTPETGGLVAFTDLPDGTFYTQAFQSYTGSRLADALGNDTEVFGRAAASLGGKPELLGDRAFSFRMLPFVRMTVVCWMGDEDLPPSYRILFDAAVGHHLPTDACAVLGSMLTRRLLKAAKEGIAGP